MRLGIDARVRPEAGLALRLVPHFAAGLPRRAVQRHRPPVLLPQMQAGDQQPAQSSDVRRQAGRQAAQAPLPRPPAGEAPLRVTQPRAHRRHLRLPQQR
jgi:hypothetical protein